MSSSELHPYLELCQFAQTLLKTKVTRWKAYFLIEISKRPLCIICRNGWCITQGMQPKRRVPSLESHCYNKSYPGPKLTTSLRLMIKCFSLFVSNPSLTFLSSACPSFTPNQVYSLVCVYHRVKSLWFHQCHLITILPC
jgi:hypothetical protein